ncbi:unannotated protein [freshwater metagenome]|uniref:Unannotated protein n=1 Tax=freshwater metagenome TaxID=449393 RepID=A0A6J7LDR2_9ZZZZ
MHTGVKSAGWLKNTAQAPSFHAWKSMVPSVVSAVKLGASSPRRIATSVSSIHSLGVKLGPLTLHASRMP